MQYNFLKQFPRRMKNVGLYGILIRNSILKTTWKQYGFETFDEQMNLIFSVMLYLMEQSLKEEVCTMDAIGAYIDDINAQHLQKELTYSQCRELGDFIVNGILSNEGKSMYFQGFSYESNAYEEIHISYIANRIVYVDSDYKRTSYYLTDDGYNLLLGTLEMENNMKLTIHEMIFQMHLERQSYDKAVDEIKNVFNLIRIQIQKISEAMVRIRRNALSYSVKDYEEILEENLSTISNTRNQFQQYRDQVKSQVRQLEDENINVQKLTKEDDENLTNLRIIESYLNRTIDEHQRILSGHFDLKQLYTRELENLTQMSYIQRFSMKSDLFDPILKDASRLDSLDHFLRPLFIKAPGKMYNLNKAFQFQRVISKHEDADSEEIMDFDEESWIAEKEMIKARRQKKYELCLTTILEAAASNENHAISLGELQEKLSPAYDSLIPSVEIFREIMVELIKNQLMDLEAFARERSLTIQDSSEEFSLNETLLSLVENSKALSGIRQIECLKTAKNHTVIFENVTMEDGSPRTVRCSDVRLSLKYNLI